MPSDTWAPQGTLYRLGADGLWHAPGWPTRVPGGEPDPVDPTFNNWIRHTRLRGSVLLVPDPPDPEDPDPPADPWSWTWPTNTRPARSATTFNDGTRTARLVHYEDYSAGRTIQQVLNTVGALVANTVPIYLAMPSGEFTFSDFSQANMYGLRVPVNVGILGNGGGPNGTVFKMVEGSSTKGPSVPQPAALGGAGGTNQFHVMGIQNLNLSSSGGVNYDPPVGLTWKNFSVIGTWQPKTPGSTKASDPIGHMFNGIRFQNTRSMVVENIYFEGFAGNQAAPPGETFGINIYKGSGFKGTQIESSGRRERQGETRKIGSSPIGYNFHDNSVLTRCYFHDGPYGMPTAYMSENLITYYCRSINNRTGFNHERVALATHNYFKSFPLIAATGYPLPSGDQANPGNYNFSFMNDGMTVDGVVTPVDGYLYLNGMDEANYGPTRSDPTGAKLVVYMGSRGTVDKQDRLPIIKRANGAAWPSTLLLMK